MEDELDLLSYVFIDECRNHIAKISEIQMNAVSKMNFSDYEMNKILRILHSIKGSSSMMGYMGIAQVSHSLEELFIYFKDNSFSDKEFNYVISLSKMALNYISTEINNIEMKSITSDYGYSITKFINNFLMEKSFESENFSNDFCNCEGVNFKPYIIRKNDFRLLERKVKRLVHILSIELNKDVNVIMNGTDTLISDSINDKVSISVIQMINNSMDHGIESSEKRLKLGKDPKGTIKIDINKYDDFIEVSASADGAGLDRDETAAIAFKKGFIKDSEYTDSEIYSFIMYPGFTTRSNPSLFSGRGIGLDTVKAAIGSVGGCITILSEKNKGTNFIIKIPLK